jgi:hypothetical protein
MNPVMILARFVSCCSPLLAFGFCAHVASHGEEQMMNQATALEMSANIERKSI